MGIFIPILLEYALNTIKFIALDSLLKPVELADLERSINKARKVIDSKKLSSMEVIHLLHNLDNKISERRIAMHEGENVHLIKTSDILYIE